MLSVHLADGTDRPAGLCWGNECWGVYLTLPGHSTRSYAQADPAPIIPESASRCGQYAALYQEVMHGLGSCKYDAACPVVCKDKHLELRDNMCFGEYLNLHPHLCADIAKIGKFCDVDITRQCTEPVNIGDLQADSDRFSAATLIGAAKDIQLVAEIGISDGIPTAAFKQSRCELGAGNLRAYGGSQSYQVPVAHSGQTDNLGILVLESEGEEGTILHTITMTDHDEHPVPNTFSLVQIDTMDSTMVYGVVTGSCLGSVHASPADSFVASLCRYSTETGVTTAIHGWKEPFEVNFATAAFDPFQKIYFVGVYDTRADIENIEAVPVASPQSMTTRVQIGDAVTLETLFFETSQFSTRKLYGSMILDSTCALYVVDVQNQQFIEVASYGLESEQHFTMLTAFEQTSDALSARYLSLLYETNWNRHEIIGTDFNDTARQTNSSWDYMMFADIVGPATTSLLMMDVETPLHHRRRTCHGKHCTYGAAQIEPITAPAITFLGSYEKLAYVNESVELEVKIADLNTPVLQLTMYVEVANDQLVRESEIMVSGSTDLRLITIYPVPSAVGFCRITIFVQDEDEEEYSKASFMLYVGHRDCTVGEQRPGCEYANLDLEITSNSYIFEEEFSAVAGTVLDYRIQSKNQFDIDILSPPNFLQADCALPWYRDFGTDCSTVFIVDCIAAPGHGRDDFNSGSTNITSDVVYLDDGIYQLTSEPLRRSGTYTVFTLTYMGEQVRSSPFTVLVEPAEMHPAACDFFGEAAETAFEGSPAVITNRMFIRARDRFSNERPAGQDHFGLRMAPTIDFADLPPDHSSFSELYALNNSEPFVATVGVVRGFEQELPNDSVGTVGAVYEVLYWFEGPVFLQHIEFCSRAASDASGPSACDEHAVNGEASSFASNAIYVTPRRFYAENGLGQFETDASYIFIDAVCLNASANPNASADVYDAGRGWQTPLADRQQWTGKIEGAFNNSCKAVGAGVPYSFFVQSVDEFGNVLEVEDPYATETLTAVAIAEDNTKIEGWAEYEGAGVYRVSIEFQIAGWQPLVLMALGSKMPNTPLQVSIVPGALSAIGSTVDGVGTVMATEGIPTRMPEGNTFYIRAKDLYGNTRDEPLDLFAMDPLENEKFFEAVIVYDGEGTHRVKFWWDAAFVQNYHVCLRYDPTDPVGGYGACSWRRSGGMGNPTYQFDRYTDQSCEGNIDDLGELETGGNIAVCSLHCLDDDRCASFKHIRGGLGGGRCLFSASCGADVESHIDYDGNTVLGGQPLTYRQHWDTYVEWAVGDPADKIVDSVFVYMRVNQGSKFTDPIFSEPICLNNIFDDYACSIYTGIAGFVSSFTIESRNELEFPNYRGGDVYHIHIDGPEDLNPLNVTWLRIQYYLLEYTPTISGTYTVSISLDSERHGMGRRVGMSPYVAEVHPDVADPMTSYFYFPATFMVGDMNGIHIFVRDQFNNTCEPAEDQLLQVFTHTEYGHEVAFPAVSVNETDGGKAGGAFATRATLQHAGWYDISVQIWTRRDVFPFDFVHQHILGSPDRVHLRAAPCSSEYLWIVGIVENDFSVEVGEDNLFTFQARDAFGNNVNETGMTVEVVLVPRFGAPQINNGQPLPTWEATDSSHYGHYGYGHYGGTYLASYTATEIGEYQISISAGKEDETGLTNLRYSPFVLTITPGPPAKVVAFGPGMLGAEAGVQVTFAATLFDRFDNQRNSADNLVADFLRVQQNATASSDVVLQHFPVSAGLTPDLEDGSPFGIGFAEHSVLNGHSEDIAGRYDGSYILTSTGTTTASFFVDGQRMQRVDAAMNNLTDESVYFQVSYGLPGRGVVSFAAANTGNGVALGLAGGLLTFEVQLLDPYQNRRLVDDAALQVELEVMNNFGQMVAIHAEYMGIEFLTAGRYMVTLQLNVARQYRLWVRTAPANPAPLLEDYMLVIEDELNREESGINLIVEAGSASATNCIARISALETSNIEAAVSIQLYDVFDNRNVRETNLQSVIGIRLTGPVTIIGVATWDTVNSEYIGRYLPIVSGAYVLEITLRGQPVDGAAVTVIWGPTEPTTTTASGLGIIRTEPTTESEITLTARDASGNLVRDDIASRFTLALRPEDQNVLSLQSELLYPNLPETSRGLGPNFALFARYTYGAGTVSSSLFSDGELSQLTDGLTKAERAQGTEASVGFQGVDPVVEIDLREVVVASNVRVFVGGGIDAAGGIAAPVSAQLWTKLERNGQYVLQSELTSVVDEEQWLELHVPETEMQFVRIILQRRLDWVMVGEIQVLGTYGLCNLAYNVASEGTGTVVVTYQVEYDPKSRSLTPAGTFCGNYPIEFTEIRYLLDLSFDGNPIAGSSFLARVGVYVPPAHKPYICDQSGVEAARAIGQMSTIAGTAAQLFFKNVYLEGLPDCVFDECMVRWDDVTSEQSDEQGNPTYGAGFAMQAVNRLDGSILSNTFAANATYLGVGLYEAVFAITRVGDYSLVIQSLSSGNSIDGMPFNVSVLAAAADPARTNIQGANRPTTVDSVSSFTVISFDRFGNRRSSSDSVQLVWQPGTVANVQAAVFNNTNCPGCWEYTVNYMVQRCTTTASFSITLNSVQTGAVQTVPCAAGPIGTQTELISRTMAGGMNSGQTEALTLQGKDSWGNLKTGGGDASRISVQIVEPVINSPTPVAAAPTASVLDLGDGTYRVSYTVRYSGIHTLNVRINSMAIGTSPFTASVGPGELNPGNSYALVPTQSEVGYDFVVNIVQRDANGNTIPEAVSGAAYLVVVGSQAFQNLVDPTVVTASITVSGPVSVAVKYRDLLGSIFPVDASNAGTYTMTLRPGPAVASNSLIVQGQQKTIDCVTNILNVIVMQTRDEYDNDCSGPIAAGAGSFMLYLTLCDAASQEDALATMDTGVPTPCTGTADMPVQGTSVYLTSGLYELSFSVLVTGFFTMYMQFESANILASPYTILSDVPAVPARCIASGPGLNLVSAGQPSVIYITARAGTAANPINRTGSGDNFVLTILSGSELVATTQLIYTSNGMYECTYWAATYDMAVHPWIFEMSIMLPDPVTGRQTNIEGSPFAVSMNPDLTAAFFSFATGSALTAGTAGNTEAFSIQGQDQYNNEVSHCVSGFGSSLVLTDAGYSRDQRTVGAMTVAEELSCLYAMYEFEYNTEVVGTFLLDITFGGIQISGAPFQVVVQSASVSAGQSFLSNTSSFESSTPLDTGQLAEFVAGEARTLYMHVFDRFRNRLTHGLSERASDGSYAECDPLDSCINMDYRRCQADTNLTSIDSTARAVCDTEQLCSAWAAVRGSCETHFASEDFGRYNASVILTKAGAYAASAWAAEDSAIGFFENSGFLLAVIPAAAYPPTTVATPGEVTVAGEYVDFTIRAYDQFRNFVDSPDLVFTMSYTFPLGAPLADDGVSVLVQEDPVITYQADGSYFVAYIIQTGGNSMPIEMVLTLNGVPTGVTYPILVRAAQNKPALCYVITQHTGTQDMRDLRLSTDLLNEHLKTAGEPMEITVQSIMAPLGQAPSPRMNLANLCTPTQVAALDTLDCDQLDEFGAVLELRVDSTVRFQDTSTTTCNETAGDGTDPDWITNDCARTGMYELSYYATVAGAYDLKITSLGLTIQTSRESVFPHNFEWYMPVEVTIFPADMAATQSFATVGNLAFTEWSTITVLGNDRFGNRVMEHNGEADGLVAVLQTSCYKPPVHFEFQYDDTALQPGTFRSTVTPNFGGPVTVHVLFDESQHVQSLNAHNNPIDAHTRTLYESYAVGGNFYGRIARLASSDPLPNTGMVDGGTSTNIPILGACPWFYGWEAEVQCKWDSTAVPSVLSDDWTYPRTLTLNVSGATELSIGASWHVGSRGVPDLFTYTITPDDFINATSPWLMKQWKLPAGDYHVYITNPSMRSLAFDLVDELDMQVRPAFDMLNAEAHDFNIALEPSRLALCGPSPSKAAVTGSAARVGYTARSSVDIRYSATTEPLFASMDHAERHPAVNSKSFFYYPPPSMDSIYPTSTSYSNNSWSHTFAPTTGGMPLSIRGTGLDNGDGAVKNYYLCVFADFDCSRAHTRAGMASYDSHEWEYGDHGCHTYEPTLDNGKQLLSHPTSLWITPATFIDDTEVQCDTPVVTVTGKARLMLTMNSQELPISDLYIEFYALENLTSPEVSPISGNKRVELRLIDGPPTEEAWCKVWFPGFENVEGMESVPAVRVDSVTLACMTPNALPLSPARRYTMENAHVPISISFDNEFFSAPSAFLYWAQPDISMIFPPVGPTGGGTAIRIELQAGSKYDRPLDGYYALDFRPVTELTTPKCIFKRTPSTLVRNRGVYYETGYSLDADTGRYTPDGPAVWAFETRLDRDGNSYLSQQIICLTPGNPNPGSYYYLEVSLDEGETYCYENGAKGADPPKFRYFADTQIVTEDRERGYTAATTFRTAASPKLDWDSTVEVWFAYSCGYSPLYASFIRCKYKDPSGEIFISTANSDTLRLGADSINSVVCDVPQRNLPSSATLQIALNGIDYTPVGPETYFIWFGRAVAVNGAFVESVGSADRQIQFTMRATRVGPVDTVVCEIIDSAENYVSEDADYQSSMTYLSIELVQANRNATVVYQGSQNLTAGLTYYEGITLFKPRQGNYEVIMQVDGLISGMIPMTVVVGPMNISNSIILFDPVPPILSITPGVPFQFTVRARDSADNYRMEGNDLFRASVHLRQANRSVFGVSDMDQNCSDRSGRTWREVMSSSVELFRPESVRCKGFNRDECATGKYATDVGDGTYFFDPFIDTQYVIGSSQIIYLWGVYDIVIEGLEDDPDRIPNNGDEIWTSILDSPLRGDVNVIDCALGGILQGALPNAQENMCQCVAGWEESNDQSIVEDQPVHVHCTICQMGTYKPLGGRDVSQEEACSECPPTTDTIILGAVERTNCICKEDFYDWRRWELICHEEDYANPYPLGLNDLCAPCPKWNDVGPHVPKCVKCYPNGSIGLLPTWWTLPLAERATPIIALVDIPVVDNRPAYLRESMVVMECKGPDGICPGGIQAAMLGIKSCGPGTAAYACGACALGFMMGEDGCIPCPAEEEMSIDVERLMLMMILFGFAVKFVMKMLEKATAEDLLIGKILLAFAQVVQSFATTYSVVWPPKLLELIDKFAVVNFDVFDMGNIECTHPEQKNFYTKFLGTVFLPVVLLTLVFLKFLHHRRKLKRARARLHIGGSLLEAKIEAIEISGGYLSKGFFVLIVTYLKTSACVLMMFKCRKFEPHPGFDYAGDVPHATDNSYLEADIRYSCQDNLYLLFALFGFIGVCTYPIGVPAFFFFLMFRERDQIHDAINKMKFGFLFGDYAPQFFMWEIFDLVRKLILSGVMIFFNRGSVTQIVVAMILSMTFLQAQVRLHPYAFGIANTCQLISFNSITFTLFGALLLKVKMNAQSDTSFDQWFCDNFVFFACTAVPMFAMGCTCSRVGYEIYLTSTGQFTRRLVGSTSRIAFDVMIAKHYNKHYNKGSKKKKNGFKKRLKTFLKNYCWKTEDIDAILLAEEMLLVQQRKLYRERCDIYLMAAKVNMAEKREWLRFVKNNSRNQHEFNDIVQNESIDTYKRRILGADTVDEEAIFWNQFEGGRDSQDVMGAAFKHKAYAQKYKDDFGEQRTRPPNFAVSGERCCHPHHLTDKLTQS